jgi:hypothetical protein
VNAWKVIFSTLVIFIAGVVTGGLLVTHTFHEFRGDLRQASINPNANTNRSMALGPGAGNPWQMRNKELLRRMDRELDLTPEQHTNIEHTMIASAERTRNLWKPIAGLMAKETQLVHAEIRAQLTPEQAKKFDGFSKGRPNMERHHGTNFLPTNSIPADSTTNLVATNAVPN